MNIFNLHNNSSPKKGCYYIFDSNVWLPLLGLESESLSEHYKNFFGKIFKTEDAKIILCPLQLSEILNRLLRYDSKICHDKKYGKSSGKTPSVYEFYKDEYRGSVDFKAKYESIMDDLDQWSTHIVVKDCTTSDIATLTEFKSQNLDFNDNYLYLVAKEHEAIIITHDGDFFNLDIIVGTYNKVLYNKYKDSIKPINVKKLES